MKKSIVQEIRNHKGKLFAKYYPEKGVIEIAVKGCYLRIVIPPCTKLLVKCSNVPME